MIWLGDWQFWGVFALTTIPFFILRSVLPVDVLMISAVLIFGTSSIFHLLLLHHMRPERRNMREYHLLIRTSYWLVQWFGYIFVWMLLVEITGLTILHAVTIAAFLWGGFFIILNIHAVWHIHISTVIEMHKERLEEEVRAFHERFS